MATQVTLNSGSVDSAGSLALKTNGTTTAVTINSSQGVEFNAGAVGTPSITTTGDTNTGIFFPAADTIAFTEGGAEAMRITSAGDVGIGTNAPASKLHVVGSFRQTGATAPFEWTVNSGAADFYKLNAVGFADNLFVATSAGNVGIGITNPAQKFNVSDGTVNLLVHPLAAASAGFMGTFSNHPLAFTTNNAERARIDSSGNLLVGLTSAASRKFYVVGDTGNYLSTLANTNGSPYGLQISYTGAAPNGTINHFIYAEDSSALRMSLRSNGGIANYSANNSNLSDRREKTNFAPAGDYLAKICAIPVQTFNYIDQNLEEDGGLTLGVVAQDVQEVAPELVTESDWSAEKDGSKMRLSVYQTDLQYALMKCIQEQQALIQSLTTRITALETP